MRASLLLLPGLLWSTLCRAEEQPLKVSAPTAAVFVTADQGADVDLANAFEVRLSAALQTRDVDVADPAKLFPPPAPASLEPGDRLFQEGRDAYDNLDPDLAAKKLAQAATFYAEHAVETPPEKLARTYVFLGAVSLLNGNKDGAEDAFRRALTLSPSIEPQSDLFDADVRGAFARVRQELGQRRHGELAVESEPAGARVMVDGKDVGLTPVPPRDVPVGRHQVVLSRPGYVSFGAFPEVGENGPTELRPVLEPTAGMADALKSAAPLLGARAFSERELPKEAQAVGTKMGTRFLVLARVTGAGTSKAEVQAWDLTTGNKLVGLTVDLSGDDWRTTSEAATKVAEWIHHPPEAGRAAFAFETPPLLKKWWFWAAVGGAAAAAAGVVAVSQGGGHRPDFVLGLP